MKKRNLIIFTIIILFMRLSSVNAVLVKIHPNTSPHHNNAVRPYMGHDHINAPNAVQPVTPSSTANKDAKQDTNIAATAPGNA